MLPEMLIKGALSNTKYSGEEGIGIKVFNIDKAPNLYLNYLFILFGNLLYE